MGDITRSWWLLLLRGLASILFGFLALIWPAITLFVLVTVFGLRQRMLRHSDGMQHGVTGLNANFV